MHPMALHPMMGRGPRVGFEFSDGTRARADRSPFAMPPLGMPPPGAGASQSVGMLVASPGPARSNPFGIQTDDEGMPLDRCSCRAAGAAAAIGTRRPTGASRSRRPGPMTIHADWADQGLDEVAIPFDADRIRDGRAGRGHAVGAGRVAAIRCTHAGRGSSTTTSS